LCRLNTGSHRAPLMGLTRRFNAAANYCENRYMWAALLFTLTG
jgi:hypothetical protein